MSKLMNAVLFSTLNVYPPSDGRIYRVIQVSDDDCIVEVKNIDAEEGQPGSDWDDDVDDLTCGEVYMRALIETSKKYRKLASRIKNLAKDL